MKIIISEGKPPWQVKEEYRKVNRSKEDILIVGTGSETSEVRFMYPDFIPYIYDGKDSLLYKKVVDNDLTFKIGSLELEYIREDTNSAWRNCRSVEVALGGWFARKFNNDITEVGDVCWQYSVFNNWIVIDPGAGYPEAIRKSVFDINFDGKNFLSLSTFEHIGESSYNSGKEELHLAIDALEKIKRESTNYLITFPIGANYPLQDYVMSSSLPFTIMRRRSWRGETNNWTEDYSSENFYLPYFHFEYCCDYFGCGAVIVVITNQSEIVGRNPSLIR